MLGRLIRNNRDYILGEMTQRLSLLPRCPYQDFMLCTQEGQRRLRTWLDILIRSLEGEREIFFRDEERVGYCRAIQGYTLEFSSQIYLHFQKIVGEIVHEEANTGRLDLGDAWPEIQNLNEILSEGRSIIATSFLKTREELVSEKVTYLQEIYEFTRKIITIFDWQEILGYVLRQVTSFFGVEKSLILLLRDGHVQGVYEYPLGKEGYGIQRLVERTFQEGIALYVDEGKNVHDRIDHSQLKRVVSVPIQAHGNSYGALAMCNTSNGFRFTGKELGLLSQLLYVTAVALENAFMLEEIDQGRQELRFLTSKMITIQEEERKRLASDIHDTLAQVLTGIGYKIQYSKELVRKDPELLIGELDSLIETVNQAIDQSKQLMTSLRPDLIDTMGLVPALKRHIDNFIRETNIQVTARLPRSIRIPSEMNICFFRVAQEALTNIYKHADTEFAGVELKREDGSVILVVEDRGKGFDISQGSYWMKDQNKLGLLSMKERVEAVGGTLVIATAIDEGCRVEAKIPVPKR